MTFFVKAIWLKELYHNLKASNIILLQNNIEGKIEWDIIHISPTEWFRAR